MTRMHAQWLVGLILLVSGLVPAQTGNLLLNGDLEAAATASPPPGWTMWGAETWKVPGNYTRDTARPHGGAACLRIHHPANTAGYLVTDPQHAIRPKRGRQYVISFWARADRPGKTNFWIGAYTSIAPYVDAPSPGRFTIAVDQTWREHRFTLVEGWDFFADHSRHLMLSFTASTERKEERTLWVDDVVVREEPSKRQGRLANLRTLPHAELQHRLTPGTDRLRAVLHTNRRVRATTRDVGGISFHRVSGWTGHPYSQNGSDYTLPKATEDAIKALRLPMTRFYALGAEAYPLEEAIDRAATVCNRTGIPQDHCVLEFEVQGATAKLTPKRWAAGVIHSRMKAYGFRHWEISNEPYITRPDAAFATPEQYIAHVKAVSQAIRTIHPTGQIGVSAHGTDERWSNRVLQGAAGSYDFVAAHHYAFVHQVHKQPFEAVVLGANYHVLEECLKLNALIRHYNPGRTVYQYDTEWGMHCSGQNGERADYQARNANITGVAHRAVRMIYYAREDILRGASSWQMLNRAAAPGFGILSPKEPDQRFMLYWLYYYFNRHLGDQVVPVEGNAPYYAPKGKGGRSNGGSPGPLTPLLASIDPRTGDLFIIVANGSWQRSVPCELLLLPTFNAKRVTTVCLSDDDLDRHPLLEPGQEYRIPLAAEVKNNVLRTTLPPHSVTFLRLEATPAQP